MLIKICKVVSIITSILLYTLNLIKFWLIPIMFVALLITLELVWIGFCYIATRFVDTNKLWEKHNPFFRFCSNRVIESTAQLLRIKLHVTGMELLPDEKFLFVGNHRAGMDPLLTMSVLRKYNMGFVAKKELYKIPILGRLMHTCFCLALDRGNIRAEAKTINRAIEIIKSQKASIGIYPEGHRNVNAELLPFMNGAFKIAKKANCPIVIGVIRNPELAVKNAYLFKGTDVYLDFIAIIDKDFIAKNTTAEISTYVRNMIEQKLIAVNNEIK